MSIVLGLIRSCDCTVPTTNASIRNTGVNAETLASKKFESAPFSAFYTIGNGWIKG